MQQVTEKRDLSSVSEVGLSEHPTCELRVFSNVKGRKRERKQRRDQIETGNVRILNSPGARALTPSRRRPRNAMAARMGYAGYAGPARPQGHTSARSMTMRRAEARARGGHPRMQQLQERDLVLVDDMVQCSSALRASRHAIVRDWRQDISIRSFVARKVSTSAAAAPPAPAAPATATAHGGGDALLHQLRRVVHQ